MRLVGDPLFELAVHPVDEPRHLDSCVYTFDPIRDAGVHLGPGHFHLEEGGAAGDDVNRLPFPVYAARLTDDRNIRGQVAVLGQPFRTFDTARFFIGGEHQLQLPRKPTRLGDGRPGVDHGGDRGLHIARSETDQLAIPLDRLPGVGLPGRHVTRRLGVEVAGEHQTPPGPVTDDMDDEIGPGLIESHRLDLT